MKNNKTKVVAFCGFIGSGKDTAADYLESHYGYHRESFASTLKDAVAAVFGWNRSMLEGRTSDDRACREQIDSWWATRLNIPHLTPRWVLQQWGTEVCRAGFHDDIWIASLENKMRKTDNNIVISDVRFPNEIAAIHNAGGIVIRVTRGPEPIWYDDAVLANSGSEEHYLKMVNSGIHQSEWAWITSNIDLVIDNNLSINDLFDKVSGLINT